MDEIAEEPHYYGSSPFETWQVAAAAAAASQLQLQRRLSSFL